MKTFKKSLLSLALITSLVPAVNAMKSNEEELKKQDDKKAKAIITLFSTGLICTIINKASTNKTVQSIAGLIGLTPGELNFVAGLTGSLYALDNLGVDGAAELAGRVPLATLTLKAVNSDTVQEVVKQIPLVGEKIGCTNAQRGVRNINGVPTGIPEGQFDLRRGLQFVAVYKAAERYVPVLWKKIKRAVSGKPAYNQEN